MIVTSEEVVCKSMSLFGNDEERQINHNDYRAECYGNVSHDRGVHPTITSFHQCLKKLNRLMTTYS